MRQPNDFEDTNAKVKELTKENESLKKQLEAYNWISMYNDIDP